MHCSVVLTVHTLGGQLIFLISLFPVKQETISLTVLQFSVYLYFVFHLSRGHISDIVVAYE